MHWPRRPPEQCRPYIQSTWAFAFRILGQEIDNGLKVLIALALLVVLATSVLAAMTPVLLKFIVDLLTSPGLLDPPYMSVGFLIAAFAGGHWLARSLGELRSLAAGRADQRIHRRLSLRLFKHIMALPLRFHLDRKTGALSQTLTNGLIGYRILVQHLATTVLPVILELGTMSTVLVLLGQPGFLWIIGATLLCYAVVFWTGVVRMTRPARAVSTAHIDANALLTDSILNYETIKFFCAEPYTQRRMENAFAQTEAYWNQLFLRKMLNGVLVGTIFALSLGTSVYFAAHGVQRDRMSLGDFVLVNSYVLQVFKPIEMLGFAFRDIAQGMAFIEKMIDVLRQKPEAAALEKGKPLPPGQGELTFDHVSFSYNEDRPILQNVSFKVSAGHTVALVGASGAGKSSLVRLLVRFWEPDGGRILLDGIPISEISVSSLRDAIAVVPQDTVLFNDSVSYNIAVGRSESSVADIVKAARLARIHDLIVAKPRGYETTVGERGLKLSGGEKQRIAIARAALKKPRIFVFDEATSSLDTKTELQILRNLYEVCAGTTTLVIAHRLSTIVNADEILVLEHGKIVEQGVHQDLLGRNGVYHGMWCAQLNGEESRHDVAV